MAKQAEDLNLGRMKDRIIKYCWLNQDRFPKVADISKVTGVHEKTIHKVAKRLELTRVKR
jgi:DNA-binding transcriptional regulator YhcF (GntR family)